ncbi:hypothetical protein TNCV_4481781 [Trichonephila clavipes]|nr:hypothetical protein TNCV_4481781 [Trichonephila clavipes]
MHRGKGLDVRLSLALSLGVQVTEGISSENSRKGDRWRHHRFSPPQFRHGTEGERNILQSPALVIQPTRLRTHGFIEHVLRVYLEGIWSHWASNPGLPVWNLML